MCEWVCILVRQFVYILVRIWPFLFYSRRHGVSLPIGPEDQYSDVNWTHTISCYYHSLLWLGPVHKKRSEASMGIANKRDSQLVKETIWHEEIQTLLLRVQSHANWRIGANTPPISFPYYERGKRTGSPNNSTRCHMLLLSNPPMCIIGDKEAEE